MIERGSGLGLAPESLQRLAILRQFFGKKLQRDKAAEARVFGFVDHAHAAAAELFDDPVMGDGLVEQGKPRPKGAAMLRRGRRGSQNDLRSAGVSPAPGEPRPSSGRPLSYQRGLRRAPPQAIMI